jgi:hypothetical protein
MTDEMIALARRAMSCRGWRWMPGMADQFGRRVMQVYPNELGFKWSHLLENNVVRDADALPDLTDAATLGCFLALVREAWGDPKACVRAGRGWEWVTDFCVERRPPCGKTEAEALIAALDAAPNTGGEHRREEEK